MRKQLRSIADQFSATPRAPSTSFSGNPIRSSSRIHHFDSRMSSFIGYLTCPSGPPGNFGQTALGGGFVLAGQHTVNRSGFPVLLASLAVDVRIMLSI